MSKPPQLTIPKLLADIHARLDVIEDYMIWLIRANQRFRVGQRVRFSRRTQKCGYPTRKRAEKGTILAKLAKSGDLVKEGATKGTRYRLPGKLRLSIDGKEA